MSWITRARSTWQQAGASQLAIVVAAAGLAVSSVAPAHAQDLVHRFVDPSFGGNPFYSDHLLAIANIDRPKEKTTPAVTPTDEELVAQQLRARLLSQLQGNILDSIQNANVGDTGDFTLGNQMISFVRTATETRVTFTNTTTGEVNTVVIPVAPDPTGAVGTGSLTSAGTLTGAGTRVAAAATSTNIAIAGSLTGIATGSRVSVAAQPSAEQALGAFGTVPTGSVLPPF